MDKTIDRWTDPDGNGYAFKDTVARAQNREMINKISTETADRKAEVNTERKRIDNLIASGTAQTQEIGKKIIQDSSISSSGIVLKGLTNNNYYYKLFEESGSIDSEFCTITNQQGKYTAKLLKPGLYYMNFKVHVEMSGGFSEEVIAPLKLFKSNTLDWSTFDVLDAETVEVSKTENTSINKKIHFLFKITEPSYIRIYIDVDTSHTKTITFRIDGCDIIALDWKGKQSADLSELHDLRIGADGVVHNTAGEAVRKQIGNLTEDLGDIGIDCISIAVVSNGYFTQGGGNATDDTCRKTDYIKFDKNEFIILKYIFNGYIWCCYELYDANKTSIGERVVFTSEANRVVRIYPTKDTQYIRFAWSITNIVSITASLYEKTGYSDAKIETVKKNLLEEIDNLENDDFAVSQGYIPIKLITDKFLTSSGIAAYANWSATENIKVEGLDCIYTEWSKTSSYNKFLDSSFGLIKMVTIKDGLQKTNVPEGSCYVAFSNETTVMEGLRVWSPTKTNLYENALEISKLKQDIPSYYEKHLTDKITEVRAKETFSGVSGDEFIFITDYHMERNANNSPSLIDKIIHQTGAKKIVFGGDAYDASSAPDLALNKIADFYSMFYENADKILSCVGNHEYNNPASNKPEQQIPNGQVYASIVNRNDLIHHSRYTCNYTILNRSNETMYVFIGCEYSSNITNESIKYVLETIKNNYGYNIIVFSHVGLDNGGDDGNVANIVGGFKRMTDGIDKFNQKSNYIFDGITYDYSGCTGEVICVFSGHNHVDGCIRTDGGLNVISTTCDAYGAPEGGVVRTKGTITEQAFDVVNIDYENKKIYMTRVGAGEDRVFSY